MRLYDAGRTRRLNKERRTRGEPGLGIGIGLNYGPAVLGDVGSAHSFSFTVIGDTVNTVSRLQALTRSLETPLVVGDAIVSAGRTKPSDTAATVVAQLQDQGERALRGRAGAVRIWTRGIVG
jgi:adenylate cyclase